MTTGHLAFVRANVPEIDAAPMRSISVIAVNGDVADRAGAYALRELAIERRIPVLVVGPAKYQQGRIFLPEYQQGGVFLPETEVV